MPDDRRRRLIAVSASAALLTLISVASWTPAVRASATFVVNKTGDASDLNPGNGSCDTSTNAGKQCTMRAAIQEANALSGADTINFNFATTPAIIIPATPLPSITGTVTIDGLSQTGTSANNQANSDNAVLKIVLRGTNAGDEAVGLNVQASNSVIKGLVVQSFSGSAILLAGNGNSVRGSFVGTNAAGAGALPNFNGIVVTGANNSIGAAFAAGRNVISGNDGAGVFVKDAAATGNVVQGNFVGINAAGTAALPNGDGVLIGDSPSNTIGGTAAGARNVISGNDGNGVSVFGSDTGDNLTLIAGNYIGVDPSGNAAIGNGNDGVFIGANGVTVGGTTAAARNVISGNHLDGVLIFAGGHPPREGNVIQGNYIGTNAAGTAALGNVLAGVQDFGGHRTIIGGTDAGAGNVISANGTDGISLFGSTGSVAAIQGNKIGTKADGSGLLGNQLNGISIQGPDSNVIGGTGLASNLISHSNLDGIHIIDSTGNLIRGNAIQQNGGQGVDVESGPNTVSGNVFIGDDEGIRVESTATGIRIVGNQMINNGGLGINLIGGNGTNHGVTENDTDDPDTGANNLQNFPVLTSAIRHTSNGLTNIIGTLNSNPNTTFRIELFLAVPDVSGHGEAQVLVAAGNFTTNSGGDTTFAFASTQLAPGQSLTTTATSVTAGNSSEFSANLVIVQQP